MIRTYISTALRWKEHQIPEAGVASPPSCCLLDLPVDRKPASHCPQETSTGDQGVQAPCRKAVNINSISELGCTGHSTCKPLTWAPGAVGRRNVSVENLQPVAALEKCAMI